MCLIGMMSFIAISALGENNIDSVFPAWRCPTNGGINVLYCYLRINGIPCSYSNLLRSQEEILDNREFTALTMEQLAAKNSRPLEAVSLNMGDLKSCSLPVIVHMDGESPQAGAFLLLFGISDREVDFMYGPSASIRNMDPESFMRVWSGTALLPAKEHHLQEIIPFIFGLGIGLVLIAYYRHHHRAA
jgi:ABC-type bacteriocin/lantibiotic exporter with double-glycine peptidase domain